MFYAISAYLMLVIEIEYINIPCRFDLQLYSERHIYRTTYFNVLRLNFAQKNLCLSCFILYLTPFNMLDLIVPVSFSYASCLNEIRSTVRRCNNQIGLFV